MNGRSRALRAEIDRLTAEIEARPTIGEQRAARIRQLIDALRREEKADPVGFADRVRRIPEETHRRVQAIVDRVKARRNGTLPGDKSCE